MPPAKVIVDFSKLERDIGIFTYQHKIAIRQEDFNERRSVKGFIASLCHKHSVLQSSIIFINHQLLFSIWYTHFKYSPFTIRLRYSCAHYKWLEFVFLHKFIILGWISHSRLIYYSGLVSFQGIFVILAWLVNLGWICHSRLNLSFMAEIIILD